MKAISSILLLLHSTNESKSFSPSLPRIHRTFVSNNSIQPTRLDYSQNDSFLSNGSPYLHRVANLRGGDAYNSSNNSDVYGSLNSLSVSELKRILNDRSIDYRDCLEKRDLIERILTSPASSTPSAYSEGGLSQEENRVVNTFTRASPSVAYIQTVNVQRKGFELKGTEVPVGAGSGFLWDDRVSCILLVHCAI